MWILKLGGSWLKSPKLIDFLNKIIKSDHESLVFVVGGGIFANSIRRSQEYISFDDKLAHFLALKATENFAKVINNVCPKIKLEKNLRKLSSRNEIKIWLPYDHLVKEKRFVKNWQSTSDSVATWLSVKLKFKGVIFIKSLSFKKKNKLKIRDLQKKGILDKNVLKYKGENTCMKIIGPEILDLFEKNSKWPEILKNIKDIEL